MSSIHQGIYTKSRREEVIETRLRVAYTSHPCFFYCEAIYLQCMSFVMLPLVAKENCKLWWGKQALGAYVSMISVCGTVAAIRYHTATILLLSWHQEMPMDMSPDSGINELQGLSPEEQERQKQEWQQELIKQSRNDQPIDNGAVPEFELGPADNGAVPEFELGPADNGAIPEFELVPADNVAIPEFELVPADNGAIPEFELGPFDDISPTLMAARFDIAIISPKLSKTRLRSRVHSVPQLVKEAAQFELAQQEIRNYDLYFGNENKLRSNQQGNHSFVAEPTSHNSNPVRSDMSRREEEFVTESLRKEERWKGNRKRGNEEKLNIFSVSLLQLRT
uniref:Uncharacterized protein n=1 Tax=Timema tahoe TaxID=61484 RepID=A0A7R9NVI2_9NEOP|nr:unnamed protein product [Timema tahoe]